MSRDQKMDILRLIESAPLNTSEALVKFDIPRSTYYRWKRKFKAMGLKGLQDNRPHRTRCWNQLLEGRRIRFWNMLLFARNYLAVKSACVSPIMSDSASPRPQSIAF